MNKQLQEYIKENVFPIYDKADGGHGMAHISYVIDRSLRFGQEAIDRGEDVDLDLAYAVAAYHDTGHPVDPKNHEMLSAEIVRNDEGLRNFFSEDEIKVIAEAVEDHRSSKGKAPRSIYGEIVSTADRNTSLDQVIMRTYQYRLKHYPDKDLEWMIEDSRELIASKFAFDGPAAKSMYFDDREFKQMLKEVDVITKDPDAFRERYLQAIGMDDFTKAVEGIKDDGMTIE